MKILFLSSFLLLSSLAWAQKNPLIRVCNQNQGEFRVLDPEHGELAVCYFGSAAIGALDLVENRQGHQKKSVQAFLTSTGNQSSCADFSAEEVSGSDSDGHEYNLCQFSDKSLIDQQTLFDGPDSSQNKRLTAILKK